MSTRNHFEVQTYFVCLKGEAYGSKAPISSYAMINSEYNGMLLLDGSIVYTKCPDIQVAVAYANKIRRGEHKPISALVEALKGSSNESKY